MKADTHEAHADFDLAALTREMRAEDAYAREGHTARTLVRERDLRVVLVAMRAGSVIREHRVAQTATVQCLAGSLTLQLPERAVELRSGHLLALEGGVPHDVRAHDESAFVLTLGWRAG